MCGTCTNFVSLASPTKCFTNKRRPEWTQGERYPDRMQARSFIRDGKRGGVIKKLGNCSSDCPVFMLSQDPSHVSSQELAMFSVMDWVSLVVEAQGKSFSSSSLFPHMRLLYNPALVEFCLFSGGNWRVSKLWQSSWSVNRGVQVHGEGQDKKPHRPRGESSLP